MKQNHEHPTRVCSQINVSLNPCGITHYRIERLQRVQNSAARVFTGTRMREHIFPVLRSLHWLPVSARIMFKILALTFKCVHGLAPFYLSDLISLYQPERSLRSTDLFLLNEHFTLSHRSQNSAFTYVAPKLWNALPSDIRLSPSLIVFKSKLKTKLFKQSYPGTF